MPGFYGIEVAWIILCAVPGQSKAQKKALAGISGGNSSALGGSGVIGDIGAPGSPGMLAPGSWIQPAPTRHLVPTRDTAPTRAPLLGPLPALPARMLKARNLDVWKLKARKLNVLRKLDNVPRLG